MYSLQHENGGDGGIIDAAFSDDGAVLVTIEQNSIARWAVASGRLTGYWQWPRLTSVAISADGRYALIGSKDNQAVYFDLVAGRMRYVFAHHEKVNSVALSRDGRYALTGSDDWHASLWDLSNGAHRWAMNLEYKVALVPCRMTANWRWPTLTSAMRAFIAPPARASWYRGSTRSG